MLQPQHIEKLKGLNKYRDIDHLVLYFLVWDHPGFYPFFILIFVFHAGTHIHVRRQASRDSVEQPDHPMAEG